MRFVSLRNLSTKIGLLLILALLPALLSSCGGSKKVSQSEYSSMSPSDKITYLTAQVEKDPENIVLKKQLYKEYLNLDMAPQALNVMEEVLIIDPTQVDIQFEYGELQYKQGNTTSANRAFLNVLNSVSGDFYTSRIANYVSGNFLVQAVTAGALDEGFPSFSPDGKKMAFQKFNGNDWDIVEFDLETRQEIPLAATSANEEAPVYSPDGKQLVYTSTASDRRPIENKVKVREIRVMERSDRFSQNLTQSVADDWLPRYSNNAEMLLFVSERSDLRRVSYVDKQSDIFIMERDGDFQHRLTDSPANEGGASFSADDKRIFFHSNKNGVYDLFSMKTSGKQVLTIVDSPGNDVNPSASPKGDHVVFMSDRDGNFEIYRVTTEGSQPERLTYNSGVDANPVFSPDGKSVAFHSDRNGNFDIFVINLDYESGAMTKAELIQKLGG
ncbi:MAG: hypothetical protein ACRBF0_10370 [Calditrichia bacterium]